MTAAQIDATTDAFGHLLRRDLTDLQWLEPTSTPISTELEWSSVVVTGHYCKPDGDDVTVQVVIGHDGVATWRRSEYPTSHEFAIFDPIPHGNGAETDDDAFASNVEVFVGDWDRNDEAQAYDVGYAGVFDSAWSGGVSFWAARPVLEAIDARQKANAEHNPGLDFDRIRFDGDEAVLVSASEAGAEYPVKRNPVQGGHDEYLVGFGWTWGRLGDSRALCVVRADSCTCELYGSDDPDCEKHHPEVREEEREVLVHLNVTVPADDDRTADEIADAIRGALEVGSDDDSVRDLTVAFPLAEAI